MHLIYRKLNGYNVPETLPPELVPPSTRDLNESVNMLKKTILEDIAKKRNLNNFSSSPTSTSLDSLSPPTPYRSRSLSPARPQKKENHDDDKDVGYVSSARRMGPDRTRLRDGSSPQLTSTASSYGYRGKQTRIFDLRKEIDEKKKYIQKLSEDAVQKVATPYNQLGALDKRDIEDLKERINELQEEISKSGGEHGHDAWNTYIEKTAELSNLADQEKSLETEIQYMLNDTLKGLLAQVDETEDDLREKKIQAVEQKAKNAPASPDLDIVGTGPNGEVTESDRIRAKAKALVAARMGKITGKPAAGGTNTKADVDRIHQEREEFKIYTDSIADSIREMEQALNQVHMEISMIGLDIRKQDQDQKKIEERGRFEYGENVAKDLKAFISELNYTSALAKAPEVDPSFESRFPSF
jgi:cell division protein FtsB